VPTRVKATIHADVSEFVFDLITRSETGPIFGSFIYRRHRLARANWAALFHRYNTLCDRPFLCELGQDGRMAVIQTPLMYYRLHIAHDNRAKNLDEVHLINFFSFYRQCLDSKSGKLKDEAYRKWVKRELINTYRRLSPHKRSWWLSFAIKVYRAGVASQLEIVVAASKTAIDKMWQMGSSYGRLWIKTLLIKIGLFNFLMPLWRRVKPLEKI